MIYYKQLDMDTISYFIQDSKNIYNKTIKSKDDEGKDIVDVVKVSDVIFTLDTETTSYFITPEGVPMVYDDSKPTNFYKDCKKQGMMYIWMVGINSVVVYGRTYKELREFMEKLHKASGDIKLIIYIHNLAFDFQFIINALGLEWDIFCREQRKVMKAYSEEYNIEFRCSLVLTNKKLETLADEYKLDVHKQVGLLDYNKLRTPLTKLTEEELKYCKYDILVLYEVIKNFKKTYRHIENIPLTQTGIVRRYIGREFYKEKAHHEKIKDIYPSTLEEYSLLERVYMGGYTHANALHSGKILRDPVYSYDITSSYPYVLCVEKYPMSKFTEVEPTFSKLKELNSTHKDDMCYIIDVTFKDIKVKGSNSILSVSKAKKGEWIQAGEHKGKYKESLIRGGKYDNGRLVSADSCRYELLDVDLENVLKFYSIGSIIIHHIYVARKEYLPVKLIKSILKFFKDKTQYKDVEGKEALYRSSKEMLNSIYGMLVTKILTDFIEYNGDELWGHRELTKVEKEEKIQKQAEKDKQWNSYAWGPWVAGYARKNLLDLVAQVGDSVVYCDTDCVKFLGKKNVDLFLDYNKNSVRSKIDAVCDYYKGELTPDMFRIKKPNGKGSSNLGEYESDGVYKQFITHGAKKYAFSKFSDRAEWIEYILNKDNSFKPYIGITVSGINKKTGAEAIHELEDFYIGKEFTTKQAGKLIAYYNDKQESIKFSDGWKETGKYGICLQPTTYKLGITDDYRDYVHSINCDDFTGISVDSFIELLENMREEFRHDIAREE